MHLSVFFMVVKVINIRNIKQKYFVSLPKVAWAEKWIGEKILSERRTISRVKEKTADGTDIYIYIEGGLYR